MTARAQYAHLRKATMRHRPNPTSADSLVRAWLCRFVTLADKALPAPGEFSHNATKSKNSRAKRVRTSALLTSLAAWLLLAATALAQTLTLHTRFQEHADGAQRKFVTRERVQEWQAQHTAIVVCDMWDQHWCKGATRRVAEMAPRMNAVLTEARHRGVLIIHCPSACVGFYKDTPMVKLAQQAPKVETAIPLQGWCHVDAKREPPLPIDDSDEGCDCQPRCPPGQPWTRQIATLDIKEGDAVTDNAQAFYLMKQRGITNVIVMGVHENMCVLGRPFSIRQMVYQGQNVVLMRDLTDVMYNSRRSPYVSHFDGIRLVTQHIERYWCPTITSADFTGQAQFKFQGDD